MNSIGVDFKLKHIELDEKKIKLQIVKFNVNILISGILLAKKDSVLSQLVIIEVHRQ